MILSPSFLEALLSPHASQRQQAEALVPAIEASEWLGYLESSPSSSTTPQHHIQLVAICLRRAILKETRVDVLCQLLNRMIKPSAKNSSYGTNASFLYATAEIPAVLHYLDPTKAQEAMLFIVGEQLPHSDCLPLLIALAERAPQEFATQVAPKVPSLFTSTIERSNSGTNAKDALKLLVNAAIAIQESTTPTASVTLLTPCVMPWVELAASSDDIEACFEILEEAARQVPEFLYPVLKPLLQFCLGSSLSLESLRVVAAFDNILQKEVKQVWHSLSPQMAERCFPFLLEQLHESAENEENENPNGSMMDVMDEPQTLLQSLLFCFHQTPVLLQLLKPHSADWKDRYASAAALASAWEVVPNSLLQDPSTYNTTLDALLKLAADSAWPVQYQAVTALGFLSLHREDDRILQVWARHCLSSTAARVAAVACDALVTYAQTHSLTPAQLEFLVPALPLSPQSTSNCPWLLIRSVGALAMLAESTGEAFEPWYAKVMPFLVAPPSQNSFVQEAFLEAATIVGQAVGEVFEQDAQSLLELILPQLPDMTVMKACSRIASVLKENYRPYMERVLPLLLQKACEEPDFDIQEGNEADLEKSRFQTFDTSGSGVESMTVALPGRGITKVSVNTSQIQEKAQAISCLAIHAEALGHFFPHDYLEKVLPMVSFRFSPDVRRSAAQAVAAMFEAICQGDEEFESNSAAECLPVLANALSMQLRQEETIDIETMYALSDALSDIYYSVYRRLKYQGKKLLFNFSLDKATVIVKVCVEAISECLVRRKEATDRFAYAVSTDEYDEINSQLRAEEDLMRPLVDSIGYSLKFFKEDFIPVFESLVAPVLGPCLTASEDTRALYAAVCLFDDCVEHCGTAAAEKYAAGLYQGIMIGINDQYNNGDDELKQVSIYGIAQIARYSSGAVLQTNGKELSHFLAGIASKPKEDASNAFVHENSVSALASLYLFGKAPLRASGFIKRDLSTKLFLENLPLREDGDEASICHAGLCDLIENGSISYKEESPRLLSIISEIFVCIEEGEELASEETLVRLVNILLRIQQDTPNSQALFASLGDEQQAAIRSVVENYAHHISNVVSP